MDLVEGVGGGLTHLVPELVVIGEDPIIEVNRVKGGVLEGNPDSGLRKMEEIPVKGQLCTL